MKMLYAKQPTLNWSLIELEVTFTNHQLLILCLLILSNDGNTCSMGLCVWNDIITKCTSWPYAIKVNRPNDLVGHTSFDCVWQSGGYGWHIWSHFTINIGILKMLQFKLATIHHCVWAQHLHICIRGCIIFIGSLNSIEY